MSNIEEYKNLTSKLQKEKDWITDEQIDGLKEIISAQSEKI